MIKASASNLDRIAACPGSHAAESGMPYKPSDAAAEGTMLHDVMSGARNTDGLTSGQRRYINYCSEQGKALLAEHVDGEKPEIVKEWYAQVRLLDHIVSAKSDFTAWGEKKALVIDWKFGREPVDRAEVNLQLRPYAIIAAQEKLTIELTTVAIVQPTVAPEDRVTVCQYTREDILTAKEELNEILVAAAKPDAPRIPGPHCRYCKALGTSRCPESREQAMALVPLTNAQVMPVGAELAKFLGMAQLMKPMIETLEEHAREQLLADPASIPGWILTPDIPIRTLPDVETAWAAAEAGGMTPEQFMAACSVSVRSLEDAMREKFGWRAKDTRAEFNALMGSAIVMDTKRGSIKRVKE